MRHSINQKFYGLSIDGKLFRIGRSPDRIIDLLSLPHLEELLGILPWRPLILCSFHAQAQKKKSLLLINQLLLSRFRAHSYFSCLQVCAALDDMLPIITRSLCCLLYICAIITPPHMLASLLSARAVPHSVRTAPCVILHSV